MKYLFIGGPLDGERLEVNHNLQHHEVSAPKFPREMVTEETLAEQTVATRHFYRRVLLTDGRNEDYTSVKTVTIFLHQALNDPVSQLITGYCNRAKLIEILECFGDTQADEEYYEKYGEPASHAAEALFQQLTKP